MQYAIIRSGGKQYKVNAGDVLEVDKIITDKKSVVIDDVLLVVNDGKVSVGKPTVSGAKVEATVVESKRGDKITVRKYKAKVRYRKTIGFRPELSVIKIDKISLGSDKTSEKVEKPTKSAPKTVKK